MSISKKKILVLLGSNHSLPPTAKCSGISWLLHGVLNQLSDFEITALSLYKGASVSDLESNYNSRFYRLGGIFYYFCKLLVLVLPYRLRVKLFFSGDIEKILRCLQIAFLARKFDADIVISHVYPTLFRVVSFFLRKQTPHLFYYHGSNFQELPEYQMDFFSRKCDGLITINDHDLRESEIRERYFSFPTRKILNAVRVGWDEKLRDTVVSTFRKDYGIYPDDFLVFYAGSIVPGKGVHILVKAVDELLTVYPELKLFIAGRIPGKDSKNFQYYSEIKRIASRHPSSIQFIGWVEHEQLVNLYPVFNLSVLLSQQQEGNSLFLMESIVCGVPALASRIGGIPEVVLDGKTGILINDPIEVEIVKEKISLLVKNQELYEQLSRNCQSVGREMFSYSRAATELSNFISEIFSQRQEGKEYFEKGNSS